MCFKITFHSSPLPPGGGVGWVGFGIFGLGIFGLGSLGGGVGLGGSRGKKNTQNTLLAARGTNEVESSIGCDSRKQILIPPSPLFFPLVLERGKEKTHNELSPARGNIGILRGGEGIHRKREGRNPWGGVGS